MRLKQAEMGVRQIHTVGIVGGGLIGAAWAALFAARGVCEVRIWDPSEAVRAELATKMEASRAQLELLGDDAGGVITVESTIEGTVEGADWIQENAPERLELKRDLFLQIESLAGEAALIASSTSSFTWSQIFDRCESSERMMIAHPFNPPHLMPLVELYARHQPTVDVATAFFTRLGHVPVAMKKEATGHIANRLASALWREAVYLVAEGIADVEAVDAVLRHGPGLRWSVIGTHLGYHLGGGEGGLAHYLHHLGDSQEARWRSLGAPSLDAETRAKLVEGVAEEVKGRSIAELENLRDDELIAVLKLRRDLPAIVEVSGR